MTQGYPKPWQSYQEQLDLVIARGMSVTDQAKDAPINLLRGGRKS